jgi:hypothetical protein
MVAAGLRPFGDPIRTAGIARDGRPRHTAAWTRGRRAGIVGAMHGTLPDPAKAGPAPPPGVAPRAIPDAAPGLRRATALDALRDAARGLPARFADPAAPSLDAAGAGLAAALAGASPAATGAALRQAAVAAHPFVAMAAARALMRHAAAPALRLAAGLAEAQAAGALGLPQAAIARLAALAAEARPWPAPLRARIVTARALAALHGGDWAGAARLADGAPAPPGLAALVRALPGTPPPEACRRLLAEGGLAPRLRAWLADLLVGGIAPEDPRLALGGMAAAERRVAEPLLRRNAALARGEAGAAAALLARAFSAQGLPPPAMPDGFASLHAPAGPPRHGPLVSIVVSAFDAAARLPAALDSVLAQSWRNIEVLVVDDGSADGTAGAIAAAAARDARVRPLSTGRNAGTYAARNLALAAARGAFVTFHDSDDWMHPRRIEAEMAAFADPRVQVVNSLWFRLDAAGRAPFLPRAALVHANPSFAMFRAAALRRLGPYEAVRWGADAEMQFRARLVLGARAMATLPLTLAIGLSRPGSLTTDATGGMDRFGYGAWRAAYNADWAARHREAERRGVVPGPRVAAGGTGAGLGVGLPGGTRSAAR